MGFGQELTFVSKGHQVRINETELVCENPYECLRETFEQISYRTEAPIPFTGGMVGYFSYDMARFFEDIPSSTRDDLGLPDAHLVVPAVVLVYDHAHRDLYLFSKDEVSTMTTENEMPEPDVSIGRIRSNMTRKQYENAVEQTIEHIVDGDIFQAVISRRCSARFNGDKLGMYQILRKINPSPYMFMLDFEEACLIGSSPEMLVQLRDGVLTSKPIAGTRPRSNDVEEDEKLKVELLLDEKERAEHVMLVDLHRNDLGRVAEFGSVKVDDFMSVEKFSHVQHIVSQVRGRIRKDCDQFDALRAAFPAGTVTGAPKIRAMEIIDALEPTRRGPYAGAVGYFGFNGNMDFAITIRSLLIRGKDAYLQAGAGIVADSAPEREFFETEHKMGAILKALGGVG